MDSTQPINPDTTALNSAPSNVPAASPVQGTPAPAPSGAAPDVNAQPPTPFNSALSGLVQPGPNAQDAATTLGPQYIQQANDANKKGADIMNQPDVVAGAGKHARLLAMVSGLALGFGEFGKALATKGQEGGAEGVEKVLEAQKDQQMQTQRQAAELKNQKAQQQFQIASINMQQYQNLQNLAMMPYEIEAKHLQVQGLKQSVVGQAQDIRTKALQDFTLTGDLDAYNKTLSQIGDSSAPQAGGGTTPSGAAPASGAPAGTPPASGAQAVTIPPAALQTWKNSTDAASLAFPKDQQIQQFAAVLADPKSTPQQLAQAATGAKNRMDALDTANKSLSEQEQANTNSPFGANRAAQLNAGLLTRWQVMNPGAKTLPSGFSISSDSTPKDFDRIDKLMQQTENAKGVQTGREYTEGLIANGNVPSIAQNLVNGNMDPSQLSKRSSNYNAVLAEADEYSMKTFGKHFNIAQASSDYKYATNIATQNTLKYLNSVIPNMDALVKQSDSIGRTQLPALNNAEMWAKLNTGDPNVAAYYTTLTETADQIAKILQGGGTGSGSSDAKLKQAQDMFAKGFTPDQVKAVVGDLKLLLNNRKDALIGDNIYLQKYKSAPSNQTQQSNQIIPAGATPGHDASGNVIGYKDAQGNWHGF